MAYLPKDYVGVHVRIAKFWEKYPDGSIFTNVINSNDYFDFKAVVYRTKEEYEKALPSSTGHSRTYSTDKEKSFEKGETVAIGRALAIMGFETQSGLASEEEMQVFNDRKQTTADVFTKPKSSTPPWEK